MRHEDETWCLQFSPLYSGFEQYNCRQREARVTHSCKITGNRCTDDRELAEYRLVCSSVFCKVSDKCTLYVCNLTEYLILACAGMTEGDSRTKRSFTALAVLWPWPVADRRRRHGRLASALLQHRAQCQVYQYHGPWV